MLLTSLDNNGHQCSRFPPYPDEGLKVSLTDPPLVAEAVGDHIPTLDPAADGLRRDLQLLGDLANRQQGREAILGSVNGVSRHGVILRR